MHHDSQQLPSEMSPDVEMIEEFVQGVPVIKPTPLTPAIAGVNLEYGKPGTSKSSQVLKFNIHYMEQILKIEMSEDCTVGKVKINNY